MSEPTKCYAVSSGSYSDYEVHAIYRRREDAQAAIEIGLTQHDMPYLVDGVPTKNWSPEAIENPMSLDPWQHPRVEVFDYYEGEALPAPLEGR